MDDAKYTDLFPYLCCNLKGDLFPYKAPLLKCILCLKKIKFMFSSDIIIDEMFLKNNCLSILKQLLLMVLRISLYDVEEIIIEK